MKQVITTRLLLATIFTLFVAFHSQAQNKFYQVNVEQKVQGNHLLLDFTIQKTAGADFSLAASNFSVFLTPNSLDVANGYLDPATKGPWDSSNDPQHYLDLTAGFTSNYVTLNINSVTSVASPGAMVTSTPTRIGRLVIPILDHGGYTTTTWRLTPIQVHNWAQDKIKNNGDFVTPAPDFPLCNVPNKPSIAANYSLQLCPGQSLDLSTLAVGSYQWFKDGVLLSGLGNNSIQVSEAGAYTLKVLSYSCESVLSDALQVSILSVTPPQITSPVSAICNGQSVTLSSNYGGVHAWYKDGVAINGLNGSTISVNQAGVYTAKVVASGCESNLSAPVSITTGTVETPTVSASGFTNLCAGQTVKLNSTVTGAHNWFKNGVILSGQTGSEIVVSEAGQYYAQALSGACVSSPSNTVSVQATSLSAPTLTIASGSTALCPGSSLVIASSTAKNIVWTKNGTPIGGQNSAQLTVTEAGEYAAYVFENGCQSSVSNSYTVTLSTLPEKPLVTLSGGKLVSSVSENVQWYLNGLPILNATQTTFEPTEEGFYMVKAKNSCGENQSDVFEYKTTSIAQLEDGSSIRVYPNPYVGSTSIMLSLKKASSVKITVFDVEGKKVTEIVDKKLGQGDYRYSFGAKEFGLAAGLYQVQALVDDKTSSIKVLEIR